MTTLLVGFMGGTLMGLVFVTHVSLLLVFRPPAALARRASEGSVTGMVVAATAAGLFLWSVLGVVAALLFRAVEGGGSSGFAAAPSVPYLIVLLFVAAFTAIPASLFMRDRLRHLAAEYTLFIAIFGWLIPAMVKAF